MASLMARFGPDERWDPKRMPCYVPCYVPCYLAGQGQLNPPLLLCCTMLLFVFALFSLSQSSHFLPWSLPPLHLFPPSAPPLFSPPKRALLAFVVLYSPSLGAFFSFPLSACLSLISYRPPALTVLLIVPNAKEKENRGRNL